MLLFTCKYHSDLGFIFRSYSLVCFESFYKEKKNNSFFNIQTDFFSPSSGLMKEYKFQSLMLSQFYIYIAQNPKKQLSQ